MVKAYAKGYRFERQLVHILSKRDFMVLRAPRSGRMNLALPDIVAIRRVDGKPHVVALECKNRVDGFTVAHEQLLELKEWEEKAGAKCYVVWKCGRGSPIFLKLEDVVGNKGNVGKRFASEHGLSLDEVM